MRRWLPGALAALGVAAFLGYGSLKSQDSPELTDSGPLRVRQVHDGDTLTIENEGRVRLVQIDAPEMGAGECYALEARTALLRIAHPGTGVALSTDARLDERDQFGRTLAYVLIGGENVNLTLVRRGAAAPYFFRGERGRYADQFLAAARTAKRAGRGLWSACPGTKLDPRRQVDTGTS
jgi:micrococcal nuclease